MTDHPMHPTLSASDSRPTQDDPTIDTARLSQALFDKMAAAQRDLMRARAARDPAAMDQWLLCVRASALLLACLPAHPDSEAYKLKVLAAVTLREEDGEEASHAWLMIERALLLDQHGCLTPVSRD